jgi:hypothetical protein
MENTWKMDNTWKIVGRGVRNGVMAGLAGNGDDDGLREGRTGSHG